jgi:hypothetical protein
MQPHPSVVNPRSLTKLPIPTASVQLLSNIRTDDDALPLLPTVNERVTYTELFLTIWTRRPPEVIASRVRECGALTTA